MTMRRPIDPAGECKFAEPPPFKKAASGGKIFRRKVQATGHLPFNAPGVK